VFVRDAQAGQRLTLQSMTGTTWADVAATDLPAGTPGQWAAVDLQYPASAASGTATFRFTLPPSPGCTGAQLSGDTLTFRKAQYQFGPPSAGSAEGATVTRSGLSPVTISGYAAAEVVDGQPRTSSITVQRSIAGGAWQDAAGVSVSVAPRADDAAQLLLEATVPPPFTAAKHAAADIAYRFASTESDAVTPTASDAVTVSYFNAQAVIRAAVKRYCPTTKVVFTNKFAPAVSGAAGYYSGATKRIYIRLAEIHDEMSIEQARFIAYHECAHALQYATYSSTAAMEKAGKRIFGTNHSQPIEHWADCVAFVSQPVTELSYGSTCTAKQLKYAKRTLKKKRL
jgi:hypothetical protein